VDEEKNLKPELRVISGYQSTFEKIIAGKVMENLMGGWLNSSSAGPVSSQKSWGELL